MTRAHPKAHNVPVIPSGRYLTTPSTSRREESRSPVPVSVRSLAALGMTRRVRVGVRFLLRRNDGKASVTMSGTPASASAVETRHDEEIRR
jgi:hypothetical protein